MRFLSLLLCPVLALNPLWAQSNSIGSPNSGSAALHIHVVDDPGPAQPQTPSAKGYVVQVTNAAGAPISGVAVALRLPEDGPTGRFANGLRAWVAYSDPAGIARFPIIQWGAQAGPVDVQLTAAKGPSHSGLVVAQRIVTETPSLSVVSVPVESAAVAPKPARPQLPKISVDPATAASAPPALADTIPVNVSPTNSTATQTAPPSSPTAIDLSPMNVSRSGTSAPVAKPHTLTPNPPPPIAKTNDEPAVSITNSPTGAGSHPGINKKWVVLGALGAGAAVMGILAATGHLGGGAGGAGGSGSTSAVTIGAPTISLGH